MDLFLQEKGHVENTSPAHHQPKCQTFSGSPDTPLPSLVAQLQGASLHTRSTSPLGQAMLNFTAWQGEGDSPSIQGPDLAKLGRYPWLAELLQSASEGLAATAGVLH